MFERLKSFWEGVKRMLTVSELKKITGQDSIVTSRMIERIELWSKMFAGNGPWTTDYVKSLRIEMGICREFADIAINEMEANVDNEKLDALFKAGIKDLNENLQDGLALGSFIIRPFAEGGVEYINADGFMPLSCNTEGKITDCLIIQRKKVTDSQYLYRFERHTLNAAGLTITNRAFRSISNERIGREIPLTSVEEWKTLPEEITYPKMDKMDFGYYKNPIKNRIDGSSCGVSIFDSAKELIRRADVQGARIDWEFESGERAIHVDERALKKNGKNVSVGKLDKRLYRGLNLEQNQGDLFKEYSPELRNEGFESGLETYYRQIEFNVGLAYGDLSDSQNVDKTATEIKAAKARKYNRVTAIQENLKTCLEEFVDALAFYNAMYTQNYTLTCVFNDSILTDEDSERNNDRQDVAMGVLGLAEYRAKWYGEDIKEAEKNLPPQSTAILG